MLQRLIDRVIERASEREPDFIIGADNPAGPYLRRWWLIPRNRFFNVYLHEFLRSDDDRALHDHPWLFNASRILVGEYFEHTIAAGGVGKRTLYRAGDWKLRLGPAPHRVELLNASDRVGWGRPRVFGRPMCCWTLFITGPVVRGWGFHCPTRWVPWRVFTAADDKGAIGRVCDA